MRDRIPGHGKGGTLSLLRGRAGGSDGALGYGPHTPRTWQGRHFRHSREVALEGRTEFFVYAGGAPKMWQGRHSRDRCPAMSAVGPSLSNVKCMEDGGSGHAHLHAQAPRASAKASAATRFVADVLPNSPAAPTSLKRSGDPMPADATPSTPTLRPGRPPTGRQGKLCLLRDGRVSLRRSPVRLRTHMRAKSFQGYFPRVIRCLNRIL